MRGLLRTVRASALGRGLARYGEAKGQRWAVLIGWQGLLSFFPIILIVCTVMGLLLQGTGIADSVRTHLVDAFPEGSDRDTVQGALDAFKEHAGILAIVSVASLVWSGSALFGAVNQALDALYPIPPRSFVRQRLMATGMMLIFTVLLVPVLLSASVIPVLGSVPDVPDVLTSGLVATLLQVGVGVVLGTVLFLAVYLVVPNRHQRVGAVLPGALTAGVLLELVTLVFPLYFRLVHGFATYGQTFGLFFLLMNFALFLGMVTMLGGAVNAACDPAAAPLPVEERRVGGGLAQPQQPGASRREALHEGRRSQSRPTREDGAGAPGPTGAVVSVRQLRSPVAREALSDAISAFDRERPRSHGFGEALGRRWELVVLGVGVVAGLLPRRDAGSSRSRR